LEFVGDEMQTSEKTDLLLKLGGKKISKAQLYKMAEADYSLLPMLFEGTSSPKATVRYGCASVLMDYAGSTRTSFIPTWTGLLNCWIASIGF
jgi:hypothetical protein